MEKILFIYAHKNEGLAAITHFKLTQVHPNLYGKTWPKLLICGEGKSHISQGLEKLYAEGHTPSLLVNIGVAALTSNHLSLHNVYSIRHAFAQGETLSFKSADALARHDCLTVNERILSKNHKELTAGKKELLDRELWELARFSMEKEIPFVSYKLAIDKADRPISKEYIKKNSPLWSEHLLRFFLDFGPRQSL